MKNHRRWKKVLSFTFALAVTAGTLSNNAAGLLNGNKITAAAAEADEQAEQQSPEEKGITDPEQSNDTDDNSEDVKNVTANVEEPASDDPVITTGENGEGEKSDKAVRTVMLYICGSNLESADKSATFNLHQILDSDFGKNEDVNFVVMTGGTEQWHTESEFLYDPATGTSPEEISSVYNQIWEAKSISDKDNPGQLVLLDGDGISGDGENAKESVDELMTDPETLRAFINYSAENFPAEKYDLILWDHGGGPNGGFGGDDHVDYINEINFAGLIDVFSNNAVTENGGKFDFIDFDACLMSSLDLALAFADYTDYYIASPELEPGYGQNYKGWLDTIGENSRIDTYELGKIIVDDMMTFYETEDVPWEGQPASLTVIDTKKLIESDLVSAMTDFTNLMEQDLNTPNKDGEYYFYDEFFAWASSINYGNLSEIYFDLGVAMEALNGNFINFVDGNDISTYTEAANRVLTVLSDPEVMYARCTENVCTNEPVVYFDEDGNYAMSNFVSSGIYLPAVKPDLKEKTKDYFIELYSALELMKDSEAKSFLEYYASVLSDYALICETGYAVSALSDQGVKKNDITYDMLCDYWHEGFIEEGETESAVWQRVSLYLEGHEGGEAAVKTWLEPYIRQIANEVISPDNVSVKIVEGSGRNSFIINTEDTHKRLIDSVNLTYTAELPVVEAYWENSPIKQYRDYLCPDLILGSREADVQIDAEDGEDRLDSLIRWFDNMSSTWEIESISDMWFAINDADGGIHVAVTDDLGDGSIRVPTITYDEEGYEELVALYFKDGDLVNVEIYGSDFSNPARFAVAELTFDMELLPVYFNQDYRFSIPISKSTFTLNAENADKLKLIYTDVANIPDIEDIDGDGSAITESLVITDMYKYSFDITDKLFAPAGTLTSIADAEVQLAVYDGTEKKPVVMYNGKVLTEGTDYILYNASESDSFVEAGSYEIIVYGKGEYGGTLETYLDIYEADDFATPTEFAEMSKIDYQQKNGIDVTAGVVRNPDDTVTVALIDGEENVLDIYTIDAKTGKGTNSEGEDVDLPQTGMSGAHKAVTSLAAIMLLSGAVLIKKSRKEYEE